MKNKKTMPSLIEQAILSIDGFERVYSNFKQQIILKEQSMSTFRSYIHKIASLSLYFGALPEYLSDKQINKHLTMLALDPNSPSHSSFKHAVYGLRYYFRMINQSNRLITLPSVKHEFKLPIILNQTELKKIFSAPTMLKHRIVLALIYSAGLRSLEVVNLKLSDIDFERKTIHIHQSKNKKDRLVPLSNLMAKGLIKYINCYKPYKWLFNGLKSDGRYSVKGLSWVMKSALRRTDISKNVSLHSLRHSYATHLLEQGVNIVTIKHLLGHSDISTTMIYLHVTQIDIQKAHSPLDTLYHRN